MYVSQVGVITSYSIHYTKLYDVEGDVEELKSASYPGADKSVSEQLTDMIAKIGENMNIRRSAQVKVNKGVVASYMHNAVTPNLGKIAVVITSYSIHYTKLYDDYLPLYPGGGNIVLSLTGWYP